MIVPREEVLTYRAYLDAAFTSSRVGTVRQTCRVEEQAAPLILVQPARVAGEVASIRLEADGKYLLYELNSTLETRILPQEWPHLTYNQESEKNGGPVRRREVWLGQRDGAFLSSYRGDTDKGAPSGTRIWRAAKERPVPEGSVDMLTAVFLARALIGEGKEELRFPLLDKDRVWDLTLRCGEERRMETPAGFFEVVEVVLEPKPHEGESFAEKAQQFEGVFGIHGSMHLWVDRRTGIVVRIQGDIPVFGDGSWVTLGVDVILESFSGTPPEFAPIPAKTPIAEKK